MLFIVKQKTLSNPDNNPVMLLFIEMAILLEKLAYNQRSCYVIKDTAMLQGSAKCMGYINKIKKCGKIAPRIILKTPMQLKLGREPGYTVYLS